MSDTLHYTKVVEGIKGFINKKRKEKPKSKVVLKVFDQNGDFQTYDKAIPEFSVIDQELLFPDVIKYEISIDGQVIKQNTIKDISKAQPTPQAANNAAYPTNPSLENNAMNFLFSTIMKSNEILAQSQEKNLASIMTQMQANTSLMFEQLKTTFSDAQEKMKIQNKHDLDMQAEKFQFELEKREALAAIGKDTTSFSDLLTKLGGIAEKVPMPLWGGLYKKLTGQEMPGFTIETTEESDEIAAIVKEAINK